MKIEKGKKYVYKSILNTDWARVEVLALENCNGGVFKCRCIYIPEEKVTLLKNKYIVKLNQRIRLSAGDVALVPPKKITVKELLKR